MSVKPLGFHIRYYKVQLLTFGKEQNERRLTNYLPIIILNHYTKVNLMIRPEFSFYLHCSSGRSTCPRSTRPQNFRKKKKIRVFLLPSSIFHLHI
jgi:hypothetical protein